VTIAKQADQPIHPGKPNVMPTSELARDRPADDDRVRLESRVLLGFASVSSPVSALLPLPQGMEAYRPRPVFGTTSANWRHPIVRRPQEPNTSTPELEGVQWYDPRTTHAASTNPPRVCVCATPSVATASSSPSLHTIMRPTTRSLAECSSKALGGLSKAHVTCAPVTVPWVQRGRRRRIALS
jgi:hypothetical protein